LFNTIDDAENPDRLYELFAIVVHIGKYVSCGVRRSLSVIAADTLFFLCSSLVNIAGQTMVTMSASSRRWVPGSYLTMKQWSRSKNPTYPNTLANPIRAQLMCFTTKL
jgi:hypothetical protein